MPPKDVDRMANSVDPDQTQSDQNLDCLSDINAPIFRIFIILLQERIYSIWNQVFFLFRSIPKEGEMCLDKPESTFSPQTDIF